ncbi:hypothetical protein ABVT39_002479 [Epinephelus coioides]
MSHHRLLNIRSTRASGHQTDGYSSIQDDEISRAISTNCSDVNNIAYSQLHSFFSVFKAKEKFSISTDTNIYVLDDTGTEVDEEVFSDIMEAKPEILWTIADVLSVTDSPVQSACTDTLSLSSRSSESDASLMSPKRQRTDDTFLMSPKSRQTDDSAQAKELVKTVLEQKPGGEKILKEYDMTGQIKDRRTHRDLVNIVVADMVEKYGNIIFYSEGRVRQRGRGVMTSAGGGDGGGGGGEQHPSSDREERERERRDEGEERGEETLGRTADKEEEEED